MLIATIIVSVCLAAAAQLMLKHGMNQVVDRSGVFRVTSGQSLRAVVTTPAVWLGLAVFGLSAIVWLAVLSRASLTFAYPFAALTYVIILVFGRLALHESVPALRWAGVALIVTGIVMVARGPA